MMVNWKFWQSTPKASVPAGSFRLGESLKAKPDTRYTYHIMDALYGWEAKCREYDMYYNDHPEVKSMVLSIAGKATAKGVFLEPRTEYERGKEAAKLCEAFNEEVGMDKLLYETIPPVVKYGTVLWEKTWMPDPAVQLIPIVKDYKPLSLGTPLNRYAVSHWEILSERQRRSPPLILDTEHFAEFSWNKTSVSWPFGTSLLTGLGQTLEITEQLLTDLQEYLHKSAFPTDIVQVGDSNDRPNNTDLGALASKIRNYTPGERFVTSFTLDVKTLGPAAAETRMLGEALNYLKDRLVDGVMVAPISKQNQRTLASAEVMEDDTDLALIIPVQRLLKQILEKQVYKPFLMDRGFSWRNVPKVSFHPPDENRDEQAAYYIPLVQANLITRKAAARELGIDEVDIPSDEEVLAMQVFPQDNNGDDEPSQEKKVEETIDVSVTFNREEEADPKTGSSHRHGAY